MTSDKIVRFSPRNPTKGLVSARLRDARLARRLNQSELAAQVSVSRQAISAFEAGEKNPDPSTMDRLANVLQQPLPFFFVEDGASFGELGTRFHRAYGAETKRRNSMCDVLGKWFVQTARYFYDLVSFPAVNVPGVSPAQGDAYDEDEIEDAALECRRAWGLGVGPISNVVGLLETNGVVVCRSEVPGENIDAFSFWNGARPFVFLSSDKDSAVRSRFDAAHELGHIVLHRWISQEDLEHPDVLKRVEAEANRFAGAFLLPRTSFPNEVYTPRLDAFVDLKRRWKVAIQAMVYRCKDLGIFDEVQVTNLYKQISFRRWRKREPLDDTMRLETPSLLRTAVELVVSAGRKMADEIASDLRIAVPLIAAFCSVSVEYFKPRSGPSFRPALR
jgi:Zn-dependent peptidase ImmA (M78 family)/transcriptional regulator with XRE-family HTH domain